MTPAQQDRLHILESLTNAVMEGKESISSISRKMGQLWANAVEESLTARGHRSIGNMTPQQFFAKQEAEKREFFRNRTAQGSKSHRVSQQDHNYIISSILQIVHSGTKPAVRSMLEAYGKEQCRAPEWAERVAGQTHPKKMSKTLKAYKDHAVMHDLKEGHMLSQTYKSALQKSTYSGFTDFVFTGSQIVRRQRAMQQELDAIRKRLTAVEAEAARANARIDASEKWKSAAVELYLAGEPYSAITKATGKGKTTVYEYIQGLISAGKLEARPSRQKR